MIEQVTLDKGWFHMHIPKLEHYYDECVLPEIVYP